MNNKRNKQLVWLALDANTREIMGYIGIRDEAAARKLWKALPSNRHRALGKEMEKTATLSDSTIS